MKSIISLKPQTELFSDLNLERLQIQLNNISDSSENLLGELEWRFVTCTINFNSIKALKETHHDWCYKLQIDVVWLTKIIFLESFDTVNSTTQQKIRFHSIVKTIFFLANQNKFQISKLDLPEYFSFLLMHNLHKGLPTKRLTPITFQSFTRFISIRKWIQIKKFYQLPEIGFTTGYSDTTTNNALKDAIDTLSGGDLTFRDWKDGGSFNNLTLDYGKYYVEHCSNFFDEHIYVAIALRRTLDQTKNIVETIGLKGSYKNLKQFFNPIIFNFLSGNELEEIPPSYLRKSSTHTLSRLKTIALKIYYENLRHLWALKMLLSEKSVSQFENNLGISFTNENSTAIIKHIVEVRWALLNKEYEPSQYKIRALEFDALKKTINHVLNLDLLIQKIDISYKNFITNFEPPILNKAFYESFGIKRLSNKFQIVMSFLNMVESAGIVKFLALTGWRESEFGFTVKDINAEPNLDILDQGSCPVRYTINWFIPKTNSKTKVKREITHSCYQCALKLALLVDAKDEFPCLYNFKDLSKNPFASAGFIKYRSTEMWLHFIENYTPFFQLNSLLELAELKSIKQPTEIELKRLALLSEKNVAEGWDKISQDPLLQAAHYRSTQESARIGFFLRKDLRKGFIWKYRTGTLNEIESGVVTKYLSPETKSIIQQFNSEDEISPTFTSEVVNEIMGDCLYPTPHAFRHMWAEAVYRRFDGDVGWLIRSNFKHISQNMWLAYIRNKDNRRQHNKIKRQVVSSLLNNYVIKKGVGYAGATDKLLRRLFLNTKTLSIEELEKSIEEFSRLEIEDIKSNPWGFCILRTRNQLSAKCASQGVPQRQNASPSVCLGCTNNLIQNGNIEGILLGISNDIKIIQNPKVPESFRKVSYQTVTNAHKQLKKLDVDVESLVDLEQALTIAKESFM